MDRHTTREERNLVLGKFMNALRVSGYGQPVRHDVLRGILARDRELRGVGRYRPGEEIKRQKAETADRFLKTWSLQGLSGGRLRS